MLTKNDIDARILKASKKNTASWRLIVQGRVMLSLSSEVYMVWELGLDPRNFGRNLAKFQDDEVLLSKTFDH